MKDQINTIREALEEAHDESLDENHFECRQILMAQITALSELESSLAQYEAGDMASAAAQGFRDGVASVAQQPQAEPDAYCITTPDGDCISTDPRCMHQPQGEAVDWKAQYEHQKRRAERWIAKYEADIGPLEKAGPVAQQPQEIEVQCPVCNHKFYEWPNDKQPQAEAVPVVDRVYEAAKRLVDHADFQLGGVLSAKSKARDIPSNAASKVKARHLASLRDALAKTPQQAEAVPPGYVLVPVGPTEAMLRRGAPENSPYGINYAEACYRAMIAAAIAQQKGGV